MVVLLYAILLCSVYLAPLTFTCPCVMDRQRLKPRPAVIGRRGAPMVGCCSLTSQENQQQPEQHG